jgi:hypothetical protein
MLLLILPISFNFHPSIVLYAALLGAALFLVAIRKTTAGSKQP